MIPCRGFYLIPIFIACSAQAGPRPDWTKQNGQSRNGNLFRVVCDGIGPSLDLARRDVLEKCRLTAASQLATSIRAKSITAETEKEVVFHREVSEENEYDGLVCQPGREHIEEKSNQTRVWLECAFDLSKAKSKAESSSSSSEEKDSDIGLISNKIDLAPASSKSSQKPGRFLNSNQGTLLISVVPQCSDLLIRGKLPARVVKCDSDPMTVTIGPDDQEIIVRATGHMPKTIQLSGQRGGEDHVHVFLNPKN